jgi:hypothetical protein
MRGVGVVAEGWHLAHGELGCKTGPHLKKIRLRPRGAEEKAKPELPAHLGAVEISIECTPAYAGNRRSICAEYLGQFWDNLLAKPCPSMPNRRAVALWRRSRKPLFLQPNLISLAIRADCADHNRGVLRGADVVHASEGYIKRASHTGSRRRYTRLHGHRSSAVRTGRAGRAVGVRREVPHRYS